MDTIIIVWALAALASLLLELILPGFFASIIVSGGAAAGAVAAYMEFSIIEQISICLVSSLVLFFCVQLCAKKMQHGADAHHKTNVNALEGAMGIVTTPIRPPILGTVKVSGALWSAQSIDNTIILEDSSVRIIRVEGVRLMVKEIKK